MIRRLLRRLLGPPTGDIYIVIDWHRMHIAGASTRIQGAERIRINYAAHTARFGTANYDPHTERQTYERCNIINTELEDGDQ